ncbi:SDR family oxidoreductase [Chitinimonas sp.]|uniref:SDR family NAD(P)-dependent oxidoreductase n=1 Tax=Chitinimonas sp. TaxID=1934313 RepID=UPI002F947562
MTQALLTPAHYPGLAGKVVFITGGGTGIGAALVTAFAAQRAQVAFVDIQREASLALCEQLAAQGLPRPDFIECDLRDIAALQRTIAGVAARHGDIAVLVNNAANDVRHRIEDVTPEFWDNGIAINQRPAFFAAQAVIAGMRRLGGGAIINFGSVGWKLATGGYPIYATAKASTHGLTRALARDLGPDNIRVNTVVPGWVMTEKQLSQWVDDAARAEIAKSQCLKGQLLPEHLASMVLFLASDAATMCSAQEFTVDGGWV